MFYYAINKASNSLKPHLLKIRLNQVCHLYFYENLLNFHKNEILQASRKLVYNFLADALVRPLTNLAFV